jgi:hypothetical protein
MQEKARRYRRAAEGKAAKQTPAIRERLRRETGRAEQLAGALQQVATKYPQSAEHLATVSRFVRGDT